MILTRRFFFLSGLLMPWAVFGQDAPVRVAGQVFERHVHVAGATLVLNGTGTRGVAWFKAYAAGLYLASRTTEPARVAALAGPKRLQLRMLTDLPAVEFAKALRKGMSRNAADSQAVAALEARMVRLEAAITAIGKVHDGDVVDLDFDTARGLLFSLNGTLLGEPIEGPDFYATLLLAFVGEHPYDTKLKAGLLGSVG
jgi:hypothetical protein